MVQIERVTGSIVLGEAPHWDPDSESLFYVDILGMTIYKYTPSTNKCTQASVGANLVSFIIPIEGEKNQFVVSLGRELVRIFWNSETEVKVVEKLAEVESGPEFTNNRFNDGKCDPSGRLWAGTLNTIAEKPLVYPPKGTLYSLDSERRVKSHVSGLRISNGMAFNPKLRAMYFIDSSKGTVDHFDFDVASGTISNPRPVFTLSKHGIDGIPDGMTIDTDGNLWVAIFNGSKIIRIDPRRPETLLDTIQMPVRQVIRNFGKIFSDFFLKITSVTFGGPYLDQMFVTTGAYKIDDHDVSPPENGAVYRITGLGTRGLPAAKFRLVNM